MSLTTEPLEVLYTQLSHIILENIVQDISIGIGRYQYCINIMFLVVMRIDQNQCY